MTMILTIQMHLIDLHRTAQYLRIFGATQQHAQSSHREIISGSQFQAKLEVSGHVAPGFQGVL
jgi:stalled ribosome rescue protein Dom34